MTDTRSAEQIASDKATKSVVKNPAQLTADKLAAEKAAGSVHATSDPGDTGILQRDALGNLVSAGAADNRRAAASRVAAKAPTDADRVKARTDLEITNAAKDLAHNDRFATLLYCCGVDVAAIKGEFASHRSKYDAAHDSFGYARSGATFDSAGVLVPGSPPASGGPTMSRSLSPEARARSAGAPAQAMTPQEIEDAAINPGSPRFDDKRVRVPYAITDAEVTAIASKAGFTAEAFGKAVAAIARVWATQ